LRNLPIMEARQNMIDILNHNIIALIPVYRENEAELQQTISSFQQMNAGLNIHVVFIVDGIRASQTILHKLLMLPASSDYVTHACYDSITGTLPSCVNAKIDFDLIIKHQHGGKRDSIALFLRLIFESVEQNLEKLQQRYPQATNLEALLKQHELSLFIVDSDTHFNPDALHYLFQTLWHENHHDVYCATPALACRYTGYTDLFGLGQNAEYQIMNRFVLSYLVNGECIASDKLLFGLQACGMLKAAYLMDDKVITAYGKKATTFREAITFDMNEDTFLSMLIREKNPKLIYVPKAAASTVLPSGLANFLIQKKRWRNGNALQQKQLKQQKLSQMPLLKRMLAKSVTLIKKVFHSPAAYFYLLLSIVNVVWSNYFHLTATTDNIIFCGYLFGVTAVVMLFNVRKFPRLYDLIAVAAATLSVFIFASLILLVIRIMQGNGTSLAWLALIAKGMTPLIVIAVMMRMKVERIPLLFGLMAKYILLDPVYNLIFPVYSVAKLDDLSWNMQNKLNSTPGSSSAFEHDGKVMKYKALLTFLLENVVISFFLSLLPVIVILTCFAISEILQWFVLLFAPLLEEQAQQRPLQDIV
jgi:cellulose synthase/poly-beta-1,6-N-acetylglucosamine synthase-like glycosyltransferase